MTGHSYALTSSSIDWVAYMRGSKGLSMTATPCAVSSSVHKKGTSGKFKETSVDSQASCHVPFDNVY